MLVNNGFRCKFKHFIRLGRSLCEGNLLQKSTPITNVSVSILANESAGETKQTQSAEKEDDEEEEIIVEKISRIVRNNGEDMETELDNSGVKITSELMKKLLGRAEYSWKPIFRCFSWAERQAGFQHTSHTCNLMINIMTKMREFNSPWVLVDKMREQSLITTETFAILMRRYARAGMVKAALCTFESMEKFGFKSNLEVFNILLDALCKEGKVGPATLFFEERRSEVESSTVTYNILINGWCRIRRLEEAQSLFNQMVSLSIPPSVVTYSTLIDGYCKTGRIEGAQKLLDTMKDQGCNPNVITYNSIVDALAEAGRSQHAHLMLDEMDTSNCRPNISTYNSLVKGLCKQEDLSGASKVLQLMMERRGRVELALQVKKDMEARGCDPDLATCTMVIHRLCRSNKLDEAYEHFEKMVQKGISPQYVTYEMLLSRLRKSYRSDQCRLLSEMMAVTPHSKHLPNTYKRKNTHDSRTKTIISKAQEISQRLMTRANSKKLPRVARTNRQKTYLKKPLADNGNSSSSQAITKHIQKQQDARSSYKNI